MGNLLQENFDSFGHTVLGPGEVPLTATTTYPEEWEERYFKMGFDRIDPVFKFARQNHCRSATKILSQNERETPLFEEAKLFDADANITATSFFSGSLMVLGGKNFDMDARSLLGVKNMTRSEHRRILMQRLSALNDNHIDVLELASDGLLEKQIACELAISVSALAQRKQKICSQLGISIFSGAVQLYTLQKWGGIIPMDCNLDQ